ncbi:hypothetical protein RKE29_09245 [Streptomyces sp. B1866]|uniref:hypothetical protein n=1 Tax=Streptomyces sp. B1866 TaxID=3075431 RepID=UPI002890C8E0|nr:hypothetical protein [Streptomyces sp. B1866]MDT3396825.1 hypothetical protein [Streptomyces sp. B1866]
MDSRPAGARPPRTPRWNGQPPTGKGGGAADVVAQARAAGIPVDVVWPDGAARQG